jgi:hypothetical protein
MADQTITPQNCVANGQLEVAAADYEDLTAANDGVVVPPEDGKYLLHVIDAAGGAIVTVSHGDGFMSSQGDFVGAAQTIALNNFYVIDSARFKNLSGTSVGKIRIKASAAVKVACIAIP